MAFVKFERPPKREGTEISICETGEIKINRAASKMYNVFKFKHVIFLIQMRKRLELSLRMTNLIPEPLKLLKRRMGLVP